MFRIRHWYELRDRSGATLGQLDGVVAGSGRVSRSAAASVKASAQITVRDTGQVDDWTQVRVQPWIEVNGTAWPLGVFLPDVPARAYSGTGQTVDVALLDKAAILDGDSFGVTYGVPQGTLVASAVRQIIASTGETPTGIEDDGKALATSIEAEPGDSKLSLVNDLLAAAGYFSLHTSGHGVFRADPYVEPSRRPVLAELTDQQDGVSLTGLYLPEFTAEQDVGSVPNRVRAVSQAGEDEEAWTAEAVNDDPDSPYSFDRLGYWRTVVETDVQTTSQAALQAYAERRLVDMSSPQETLEVEHPPYQLTINDVVRFRSARYGLDGLYTVQNQEWPLAYDGLVQAKLRKVVG